jgi:hypothetical protein
MEAVYDRVNALAQRVGAPVGKKTTVYDWNSIEKSLGLTLPDDYKIHVSMFPEGRFQSGIRVIRPGDHEHASSEYLGYYAYRLEDIRTMRDSGQGHVPYPIFPEPGGLLPWGEGPRGELFFWLTGDADPNNWTVVGSDSGNIEWSGFEGSMHDCIEALLDYVVSQGGELHYTLASAEAYATPIPPRELFWDSKSTGDRVPVSEFAALTDLLGPPVVLGPRVDWAAVEQRIHSPLPTDYKAFVEKYGAGIYCDIRIAAPGAPGEFDLFDFLERKQQQAAGARFDEWNAPFYPEPGGVIAWGESMDGWTCGWAPISVDPDRWGTVLAFAPNLEAWSYRSELSFSDFLVKHADAREFAGRFTGRPPWTRGATFRPAPRGDMEDERPTGA